MEPSNTPEVRTCKVTGLVVRAEKRFTIQADLADNNSATFKETAYFAGAVREYAREKNLNFMQQGTGLFDLTGNTLPEDADGIFAAIEAITKRATDLILSEESEAIQFVTIQGDVEIS